MSKMKDLTINNSIELSLAIKKSSLSFDKKLSATLLATQFEYIQETATALGVRVDELTLDMILKIDYPELYETKE